MPKFFVEPSGIKGDNIFITGEDVNHITKVLRLSRNDIIIISDGQGNDYKVVLEEIDREEIKTRIIEHTVSESEPPVEVILFQGIPKSDKMEFIIQKTTELGISKIVPVITKRTIVKFNDAKSEKNKLERWQKIALEAAKQCNRGRVPVISKPLLFDEAIERMKETELRIMPYEKEESNRLRDILKYRTEVKKIGIFIGPEGGFDEEEVYKARCAGVVTSTLGSRILRTETAGVVVLSILMYEYNGI